MSRAGASLSDVRARLRELLSLLDDPETDAAALERAMAECAQLFAGATAAPQDADELEETLRLNTVVLGRVQTELESLGRGIRRARETRRRVGVRGADRTGTSCDISG